MLKIIGQFFIILLEPLLPIIIIGAIIEIIAEIIIEDTIEDKAISIVKTLLSLGLLCLSIVYESTIIFYISIIMSILLTKAH